MYLLKNREYYIADGDLFQIDISFKTIDDNYGEKGYYLMLCNLTKLPNDSSKEIKVKRHYTSGTLILLNGCDEESDSIFENSLKMKESKLNAISDNFEIFIREEIEITEQIELKYTKNTIATNPKGTLDIIDRLTSQYLAQKDNSRKFKEKTNGSNVKKDNYSDDKKDYRASEIPNIKFDDVAGLKEVKEELMQVVDYVKNREKYKSMGVELERGILLYGPPGTGKTLIAKALSNETNSKFFEVSGSEFVEKYVGVGAKRIRDLFESAKKEAPSIIFIDEIDAVGGSRGTDKNSEITNTLNQLLVELDGFKNSDDILVIGATNRLDSLDKALIRAGRLGEHIYIGNPDLESRKELFLIHTKNKPLDKDIDLNKFAQKTHGFNGADIKAMCNTAGLLAIRENKDIISFEHLEKALDKTIIGLYSKTKKMIEHEKKVVAYHEAGHAILGKLTSDEEVAKISIIPAGTALGFVYKLPKEDTFLSTKTQLKNRIKTLLAGKVTEEIIFGEATNGASNDLEKASNIALKMVREYGMDEANGLLSLNERESISKEDRERAEDILSNCYTECRSIIEEHKDILEAIASKLLEQEELTGEELDDIFKKHPSFRCNVIK